MDDLRRGQHDDIESVNVLCSMETRECVLRDRLLNGILRNDIDLEVLSTSNLIHFYRIASRCGEEKMVDDLWRILAAKQRDGRIKNNVISRFELNGKQYAMENGYAFCEFKSVSIVDRLMAETDYVIDTLPALELHHKAAQQRHLKSHSEKKALAVLLQMGGQQQPIWISVTMRMCSDCHQFFCAMSAFYKRQIECVDPKGVHLFIDGTCSLCHCSR